MYHSSQRIQSLWKTVSTSSSSLSLLSIRASVRGTCQQQRQQQQQCHLPNLKKNIITLRHISTTWLNSSSINNIVGDKTNHIRYDQQQKQQCKTKQFYTNQLHGIYSTIHNKSSSIDYQFSNHNHNRCRRYYSTTNINNSIEKLGLGSQKWSTIDKNTYKHIIYESIKNGVTTIEAGQGDAAEELLVSILRSYYQDVTIENKPVIEILLRVGYRVVNKQGEVTSPPPTTTETTATTQNTKRKLLFPQDVQLQQSEEQNRSIDEQQEQQNVVLHNIHPEYISYVIENSSCIRLHSEFPNNIHINILLHNPEEQTMSSFNSGNDNVSSSLYESNQSMIQQRLSISFQHLQKLVHDQKIINGYGICSNGICLPKEHPLHLSWIDGIQPALLDAVGGSSEQQSTTMMTSSSPVEKKTKTDDIKDNGTLDFHILQLPCNYMETTAFDIINSVKQFQMNNGIQFNQLQIYGMRPLSCYPDRGTGTGYPFLLTDYQIPSTMDKTLSWTNEMYTYPDVYNISYKTSLQHFDAQHILDIQSNNISYELSMEERETLQGCKLLQSLLHDLDISLQTVRSYQQYEDDLIIKIVPLIRDTFDSYDDDTASVLQSYFGAYSLATKYAVATNIRQLILQNGEKDSNNTTTNIEYKYGRKDDDTFNIHTLLPSTKRLQEFALEFVLCHKTLPVVDKVIVGCTETWQVLDIISIVQNMESKKNKNE